MACCHRVLVVRHGRVVEVLEGNDVAVDIIRERWLHERHQLATSSTRLPALRGPNNEGVLALVRLALIVAMSVANPVFFTLPTAFSILPVRSCL